MGSGRVQPGASGTQGPASEGAFIRALRDHALLTVDLAETGPVVGLTPAELERRSGLSRPWVSSLIKRFKPILEGQDLNGDPTDADRAPRWTIARNAGVVAAVEIGGPDQPAWVGLSDLYGRIAEPVFQDERATADDTVDWVVEHITTLLGRRPERDVVGVGISLAAPIDRERGMIRSGLSFGAPGPWTDWQLMRVREHLRERLGWDEVPFLLDNDANLNALAEYTWGAARPSRLGDRPPYRNVVHLEWSRGIGAGLILQGELYRGAGVAGEIGHTVVRDSPDACELCGNHGCLETVAGWGNILGRLAGHKAEGAWTETDLRAALQLAADPDSHEAEAFEVAANQVSHVLGPVIHLLNPQVVIIGGDMGRLGYDIVKAPLHQSLKRFTMRPALADLTMVQSRLRERAALQGAVALILRPPHGDPDALLSFLQRRARV